MRTRTNTIITIVVGIAILGVLALRQQRSVETEFLGAERVPVDEPEHIHRLARRFDAARPAGSNTRLGLSAQHSRIHGCLDASLDVVDNLASSLTVGVFQPGASYAAKIRFSNTRGAAHDAAPDLQMLAIKLLGVQGAKLSGNSGSHDFLLFSHPVFLFDRVESYADGITAFASGRPRQFLSNPLRLQFRAFRIARRMFTHHEDLLATRWWSMVPYRYGDGRAVKYAVKPCRRIAVNRAFYGTDFLARRLRQSIAAGAGCFEFMVQFQSDPKTMPIENAAVEWDEYLAPFQPVAVIRIPPQTLGNDVGTECESLSFDRWRVLPEHRPLGGINRAARVLNGRQRQSGD